MAQYKINITTNKHLFLDIDGVLNSFDDYDVDGKEFLENIENITFILSKRQMGLLNNIIDKYHPKIILSSYLFCKATNCFLILQAFVLIFLSRLRPWYKHCGIPPRWYKR